MKKIKVLIIDDEISFAETLAERLKIRDIEVSTAESGEKGISMMSDYRPDIVLLDFTLPDMQGPDVLLSLKAIDPEVEVILVSGCTLETLVELKGAAFACLTKPMKLAELIDAIKAANHKRGNSAGN